MLHYCLPLIRQFFAMPPLMSLAYCHYAMPMLCLPSFAALITREARTRFARSSAVRYAMLRGAYGKDALMFFCHVSDMRQRCHTMAVLFSRHALRKSRCAAADVDAELRALRALLMGDTRAR